LFQNPVGFETTSWKSGQMPAFPCKSKVAVPKTEVLEQPQMFTDKIRRCRMKQESRLMA
jgi:hypothetical protein